MAERTTTSKAFRFYIIILINNILFCIPYVTNHKLINFHSMTILAVVIKSQGDEQNDETICPVNLFGTICKGYIKKNINHILAKFGSFYLSTVLLVTVLQ